MQTLSKHLITSRNCFSLLKLEMLKHADTFHAMKVNIFATTSKSPHPTPSLAPCLLAFYQQGKIINQNNAMQRGVTGTGVV